MNKITVFIVIIWLLGTVFLLGFTFALYLAPSSSSTVTIEFGDSGNAENETLTATKIMMDCRGSGSEGNG